MNKAWATELKHTQTLCSRPLPMDASTADAWFNLGNQLDDEGRFDEAIDAYQKSASISEFGGADPVV